MTPHPKQGGWVRNLGLTASFKNITEFMMKSIFLEGSVGKNSPFFAFEDHNCLPEVRDLLLSTSNAISFS